MKLKLNTNAKVADGQWIAALGTVPIKYIDLCANSMPRSMNTSQWAVSLDALRKLDGLPATILEIRHKNFIKVKFDVNLITDDFEFDTFWINSECFVPYEISSIDRVVRDITPVGDWLDDQISAVDTIKYIIDNVEHFRSEIEHMSVQFRKIVK